MCDCTNYIVRKEKYSHWEYQDCVSCLLKSYVDFPLLSANNNDEIERKSVGPNVISKSGMNETLTSASAEMKSTR